MLMSSSTAARPTGVASPQATLNHAGFRAMGCEFNIWLAADPAQAIPRLSIAQAWIYTIEAALSRFRRNSELTRLNARAGQAVAVSPLLWSVLAESLEAARATHGMFDPTVLPALIQAGYSRSFDRISFSREEADPGQRPRPPGTSWRDIVLEDEARTVTLPRGAAIDFGGIAKGWVADQVTANLAELGPALVDAGGDISARGSPAGQGGWCIGVQDPLDSTRDVAVLQARDRGVATSGTDYRHWRRGGRENHHIIDPARHVPAETDLLTATVVAPTATDADVHALVVILLGSKAGMRYIEALPDTEALLIDHGGSVFLSSGFRDYFDSGE